MADDHRAWSDIAATVAAPSHNADGPQAGLTRAELPVEVWAIVCSHLRASTPDLIRLAGTCWTLRPHALAQVEHHSFPRRFASESAGQTLHQSTFENTHGSWSTVPKDSPSSSSTPQKATQATARSGSSGVDEEAARRRLGRMVETVRFLAGHCCRLRSMDLSGAASTDNDDDDQEALPIDLLTALPTTLRSLNLSRSSIPPRGLNVLPTSLTALDLSNSDVVSLQALGRLTALQTLNLASTAITVASLQHIPDGVEDVDLSHCTKLIFAKGNLSYKFEFNCVTAKWPAALSTLKLAGVETSPAALFNLPPTVTHLDLSGSSFCIPNVDFTHQLPRLKTLLLENCKLNYTDEELWALPECLEQLSLRGSSANTRHVRYLPRTLTSLNLANTLLTNYSSLYEQDKVFYFFSTLHMRLPRLELLDVRCGYPYGTRKYAQLLREKVRSVLIDDAPQQQHHQSSSESGPAASRRLNASSTSPSHSPSSPSRSTTAASPPSSPSPSPSSSASSSPLHIPRSRSKGLTWKPREQCPKWLAYIERCAEARRNINMKEPHAEDDADKDEYKGDDGEAAAESPQILTHSHEVDGEKWIELQYGPADTNT